MVKNNSSSVVIFALIALFCLNVAICCASEFCDAKLKSHDTYDQDQSRIIRGLINTRLVADGIYENHPVSFLVSVCGNASTADSMAAATMNTRNHSTVLGRVNNTSIIKGGDWMMMVFGSGDPYSEKQNCSGPRVAFILFHCNHNISAESSMRFVKEVKGEKNSCFYMLEVHSHYPCLGKENIPRGTIFLVVFTFGVSAYIIGGVLYRRIVLGAKGLEQIPNLLFWQKICKFLKDDCICICCRRKATHEDSWSNLGQRSERDDDSLLSP